ncbi:MAG TPA: GNAT family N-acetyltransferase [Chitinispirillaceae bacterium]|nr:GNAT family N-acetyltransferase [Chitinispirillaceae bacterium]
MPNNLIQINPLVSPQWDKAVLNSSYPQFFHRSNWLKTITDTYKFKPLCLMVESEPGCTIPLLIARTLPGKKKAIALPFSDSCDIYCSNIEPVELVSKIIQVIRNENINKLEFRGTNHFQPSGEPSHSYWEHRLHLTKEDALWKNLSPSKKRNIRKAQKNEIIITFNNEKNALQIYYNLHCLTRKRHGLPPQPVSFFNAIYENIIAKNCGEVTLVYSGNTPVAGAVFLFSGSEAIYKFGASDNNFQPMRINDLLMWEAIRRYTEKGYSSLSFGKTEKFHEGLCHYKEGFGALRKNLSDHYYVVKTGEKVKKTSKAYYGAINHLLRKMPISVLRKFGEVLYQYAV